jgi:uncharacterized membrane protein YgaE (UPF0421/DUF939 family)
MSHNGAMAGEEGRYVSQLVATTRDTVSAGVRGLVGPLVRTLRLHGLRHWLERERDAFGQTAKAALAAAAAWGVAADLLRISDPVLSSVAALVVVQVTVYQSVNRAIQYSAGIVAGMVGALAIGRYLGVNIPTMSLVVVVGLVVGRTLRLGTQVNQVAVTGLLVLSFGNSYGMVRIVDSAVGAAVGVAVNTLIAPPSFARTAAKELADLSDDLAALCARVAKSLRGEWDHAQARVWLERSRSLSGSARAARKVAQQAEESIRYHPRKSAHLADVHRVDEAAIALDHVATQLNSLMRGLTDLRGGASGLAEDPEAPALSGPLWEIPEELILLLDDTAKALNAFGRLQVPDPGSLRVYEELSRLIANAKPHAREAAFALIPHEDDPTLLWSVYGALLDDSRRMLREIDPDNGPHREGIPAAVRSYAAHPAHQGAAG